MRKSRRFIEYFGVAVGVVALVVPQLVPHFPKAAVIGLLVLAAGLIVWPFVAPAEAEALPSTTNDSSITVHGDVSGHSAVGHGSTVVDNRTINEAPAPKLRIVKDEGWQQNADGTWTLSVVTRLESQFVPPRMQLAFALDGLLDADAQFLGTGITSTNSGWTNDGRYLLDLLSPPVGDYRVMIRTRKQGKANLDALFPR